MQRGKILLFSLFLLFACSSFQIQPSWTQFYDSIQLYASTKDTVYYHPNIAIIPPNAVIQKIQLSIDESIRGIIVYLSSPTGSLTLKGLGFDSRPVTHTYIPPRGNVFKKINFATYIEDDGRKAFCGIQFDGTKEQTTFYMGSCSQMAHMMYESIVLRDNPVGFYGHLHLQQRTINGIGVVLQLPQ